MESLLREIETIARRAGAAIMEVYESTGGMAVQYKDDDSPLTEADKAGECGHRRRSGRTRTAAASAVGGITTPGLRRTAALGMLLAGGPP